MDGKNLDERQPQNEHSLKDYHCYYGHYLLKFQEKTHTPAIFKERFESNPVLKQKNER